MHCTTWLTGAATLAAPPPLSLNRTQRTVLINRPPSNQGTKANAKRRSDANCEQTRVSVFQRVQQIWMVEQTGQPYGPSTDNHSITTFIEDGGDSDVYDSSTTTNDARSHTTPHPCTHTQMYPGKCTHTYPCWPGQRAYGIEPTVNAGLPKAPPPLTVEPVAVRLAVNTSLEPSTRSVTPTAEPTHCRRSR